MAAPPLDVAGLGRELLLNPAAGVARLLDQTQAGLGAVLFGTAFVLAILTNLIDRPVRLEFEFFAGYNLAIMKAHFLSWLSWLIRNGGWVVGLTFAAARLGARMRWEGILAAFAVALLPGQVVELATAILPFPLSSVVFSATYVTSLIYYLGLFQIARTATDGDTGVAPFRFLGTAGLVPAVAALNWDFLVYSLR